MPFNITTREDANHDVHGSERKGREASLTTNPKKGRAGKRIKNHAGHPNDGPTGEKHACCMAAYTTWQGVN